MVKKEYTFTNLEVLNILNWFNNKSVIENSINKFKVKEQWAIKKNINELNNIKNLYNEMVNDIDNEYSTDDKSHDILGTDENGNETTRRVVNEEYSKEFIGKKTELLKQKNDINISCISIDNVPDGVGFECLDMLSFMITEENE